MIRKLYTTALLIVSLVGILAIAAPAFAQGGGFDISKGIVGNLTSTQCREQGICGWCDFVDLMVVLQKIILYLFGGLALCMLVWGGFGIVASAGNQEKVTHGRKLIVSTLFGILIILAAYFTISAIVIILSKPTGGKLDNPPFTEGWWKNELHCYTPQDGDPYCETAGDGALCYNSHGEPNVCAGGKCSTEANAACKSAAAGLGETANCSPINTCGSYITGADLTQQRAACGAHPNNCKLDLCAPMSNSNIVCCKPDCTGVPDYTACLGGGSAVCLGGTCTPTCAGIQALNPSSTYRCQPACIAPETPTSFYCPGGGAPTCCFSTS